MADLSISEKIGALSAKVSAAHSRIDKMEVGIREDLRDLRVASEELAAHMNRSKGWAAAMILLSGVLSALIIKVFGIIIK